eukprot:13612-Heterococcus_DN1.PRE.3
MSFDFAQCHDSMCTAAGRQWQLAYRASQQSASARTHDPHPDRSIHGHPSCRCTPPQYTMRSACECM